MGAIMDKLGFIGAGKMATAIAKGLADRQAWPRTAMLAADVAPAARAAFATATGGVACGESAVEVAQAADIVLLAVKPQKAPEVVPLIAPACRGKLVISIAAGLTLKRLAGWFGHDRIIRVMPNTPLMVGKGATVFTCGAGVTAADRATATSIFGALGIVFELDETHMDAVTALSGSGPAYVFEMVAALVEAGVEIGLPRDVAHALTVQTVAGAAAMLEQGLGTPDELRNAVTSPGGTTAAGLAVMAKAEFRTLKRDVVRAAHARSIELGRAAG